VKEEQVLRIHFGLGALNAVMIVALITKIATVVVKERVVLWGYPLFVAFYGVVANGTQLLCVLLHAA